MKNYLIVILVILNVFTSFSQTISVNSFKKLESDLTANTAGTTVKDQNGETAALIKVVTTQTGFTFDCGVMGIVKTIQKPSEIWVYVPHGIKKITISHPQLGLLRDHFLNIPIESACTYEMVLVTGKVQTIITESSQSQYLVIQVTPKNAIVELNNVVLPNNNGIAQKFLNLGTYEYRVQAQNYHTVAGKVNVDDPKNKKVLTIELQPAFGWIEVGRTLELEGAQVYIDNLFVGNAPMKSEELPSGQHSLKIVKPLYIAYESMVLVEDATVTKMSPDLKENYAVVTVNVENDAEIYINGEYKANGAWTDSLETGSYIFETRKDNYRAMKMNREIQVSDNNTIIQLQAPIPIYGSANIVSVPAMSDIIIDNKKVGQTPLFIPELLCGNHNIIVKSDDYSSYSSSFEIKEGETTNIEVQLENTVNVDVICNVSDAFMFIDGLECGTANGKKAMTIGNHTIQICKIGYFDFESEITVSESNNFVSIDLKEAKVNVEISSNVTSDGIIYLDNEFLGYLSNKYFKIPLGEHQIKINASGYMEFEETIVVSEGEKRLSFKLKKVITKERKVSWESVRITYNSVDVVGLTYLGNVTQKYGAGGAFPSLVENNRKRCIKRIKKKAAKLGATTVFIGKEYEYNVLGGTFMKMPASAYK